MNMTKTSLAAASAAIALLPALAHAIGHVPAPTGYQSERCYGVNAVGKNDCGVRGVHACGGAATISNDPKSFIYVPAGTCDKINGGSVTPKV